MPTGVPPAIPAVTDTSPVTFVLYRNLFDIHPVRINNAWSGFVEFAQMVEASPCSIDGSAKPCVGKDCRFKSHSTIADNYMAWSPNIIDGLRDDKNVKAITLLVLDFDHLDDAGRQRVAEKTAAYEYVAHSTHSNRVDDQCFRTVFVLSRPVSASEFARFLATAIRYLDVTVTDRRGASQPDPVCKNRSRLYFRPSHPRGAPTWTHHNRGRVLDVDAVMEWGLANLPPEPVASASPRDIVETGDWDLNDPHITDAIDLMANYFPAKRRNEFCLALSGILRSHGADEEAARWIVREICVNGGSQNPDARVKTVDHTYGLVDGSFMTSLTRAAEILGAELGDPDEGVRIAKEFGDHLTAVAQEALLSNFVQQQDQTDPNLPPLTAAVSSGAPDSPGLPPTVPPPAPLAPVDLSEVRAAIQSLVVKRSRSLDMNDAITGVLLRRLLKGEQLAGFEQDVETVGIGQKAISIVDAVDKVAGALGFGVNYSADDVIEVVKVSLLACGRHSDGDWVSTFKTKFELAQRNKKIGEMQREQVRRDALARAAQAAGVPVSSDRKWMDKLHKGAKGEVIADPHNLSLVFANDSVLRQSVRWNEYAKRMDLSGRLLGSDNERVAALEVRRHLSECYELSITRQEAEDQLLQLAHRNPYDPLTEHLQSLVWDGVERIDTMLVRYFGAPDTAHMRRVSRRWMIGSVARAFEPGCKFDNVLTFYGLQGAKKTSAFHALGGQFYSSSAIDIRDKDSKMLAAVCWICELPEMESMRKVEQTSQRAFFTQREDFYRAPYAAQMKKTRRRATFVATTNDLECLHDPTGNRRWWVVWCTEIAFAALMRDRDQLWAEAVALYAAHEWCPECLASTDTVTDQKPRCQEHRWWLSKDEEREADEAVRPHVSNPSEAWEQKILSWWQAQATRPESLTVSFVAMEIGELPIERINQSVSTTIGIALANLGFTRRSDRSWVPSQLLTSMPAGRANALGIKLFPIPGGKK